jgi:hypothetical protein
MEENKEEVIYAELERNIAKLHEIIENLQKQLMNVWYDFEEKKPDVGQICIGLHKYGMCFFEYTLPPIHTMNGLFYVPRNASCSGLRYCVENITHWLPLPVAYDS